MNKYKKTPEEVFDLHGYTISETNIFLDTLCKNKKYTYVRIITGRGNHTGGIAALRDFVIQYLQSKSIRYNRAQLRDGGEGALEVFLHE